MGAHKSVKNIPSNARHCNFLNRVENHLRTMQERSIPSGFKVLGVQVLNYCLIAIEYSYVNERQGSTVTECDFFFATSVWTPKDTWSWGSYFYPIELDEIGVGRLEGLSTSKQIRKLKDIGNYPYEILKMIYEVDMLENHYFEQPRTI